MSLDGWISWNCFSHRKILKESAFAFTCKRWWMCPAAGHTESGYTKGHTRSTKPRDTKNAHRLIKLKVVTESGNRTERSRRIFTFAATRGWKCFGSSLIGWFGARAHEELIVTIYYNYKILLRRSVLKLYFYWICASLSWDTATGEEKLP